ncbi:MAG: AAA family ATPase [Candidatus Anstonellales archaeon]
MSLSTVDVVVKSKINLIVKEEKYNRAFLVYLASLIITLALPPYPYVLAPFISLIPAYLAYSKFRLGILTAALLAVLGLYYIGTTLGNYGLLLLSIMIFFLWESTNAVFLTFMILFLPLLQYPLKTLDGIIVLAYLLSAYTIGSRVATLLAIVSVVIIFSFITVLDINSTFFIKSDTIDYFTFGEDRYRTKLGVVEFFAEGIPEILSNIRDPKGHLEFGKNVYMMIGNITKGLFEDFLLAYILIWTLVLFIPTYLTGLIYVKNIPSEALTALPILLLIPIYSLWIYPSYSLNVHPGVYIFPILSVISIYIVNRVGIRFSKEREIRKQSSVKDMPFVIELSSANVQGFEDVAGYEDVKEELKTAIITPLKSSELKYTYNIKPARGILLFGPPGTGKTLLINALAKELDYPVLYVKTSDMLSKFYGETERNLSKLFEYARKKAPVILFFDEIDLIAKRRDKYGSDDPTARVLTILLQELDGVKDNKPIIFVGATNVPHLLDPALMRPGRVDKIIYMRPPNKDERKSILKYYLRNLPHENNIDYDKLAQLMERYSGADIANLIQEVNRRVAARAARENRLIKISTIDILEAMKTIKPSISISLLEIYEKFKLEFERRSGRGDDDSNVPKISYADVVDMEELKNEMKLYIEQSLKNPEIFEKYGLKPARGILLFGPPGTGKTYFLKATAGEFKLPFIQISGSDILKEGYDRGVAKIKEIFNLARERAPSIIVIDEIDTIAQSRAGSNPLLGQLLQELDGLGDRKGVYFMATTNHPELLDPALLRPGRIDKIMYIDLPNSDVRYELLMRHLSKFLDQNLIKIMVDYTVGYTHADLVNLAENIKREMLRAELEGRSIDVKDIIKIVQNSKPSLNPLLIQKYKQFKESFERS